MQHRQLDRVRDQVGTRGDGRADGRESGSNDRKTYPTETAHLVLIRPGDGPFLYGS
jgi:hypothetical protein